MSLHTWYMTLISLNATTEWLQSVPEESHVTLRAIKDDSTFTLYFRKLFWVTISAFWVAVDDVTMEPAPCLESVLMSQHKLNISIKYNWSHTATDMHWILQSNTLQCCKMPGRHFWNCKRDLQTGYEITTERPPFKAHSNRNRKWRFYYSLILPKTMDNASPNTLINFRQL